MNKVKITSFVQTSKSALRRNIVCRASMVKIDGHLHVWAPKEQAKDFPYFGSLIGSDAKANEPPMPGFAELLLKEMDSAGVSKALIIQPGNHMFDHKYVSSVLTKYPDKFAGVLLANPAPGPNAGAFEIERLYREGYQGVRFNPYLWPEGENMANSIGLSMYTKAGQLGIPVSHMPFKGLTKHIEEIKFLANQSPETKFIIDHYGFCKCQDLQSAEWKALLSLADYDQCYVKLSAAFRVSSEPYPYLDVRKAIRILISTFGHKRLLFGTDWPWVSEQEGGYLNAWQMIEKGDEMTKEKLLSEEEGDFIFSKTVQSLYPGLS